MKTMDTQKNTQKNETSFDGSNIVNLYFKFGLPLFRMRLKKKNLTWTLKQKQKQNKFLWFKYRQSLFQIWLTFIQNEIEFFFEHGHSNKKKQKHTEWYIELLRN